ncbi:MAG: FixH family protein [Draconibacterium sp.]|nr:FixH family protein [Draconibacterium sp.]
MKFNWGTGIFIFLILFLLACTAFMIFAARQGINLVHKDYYEKGVNYTEQMEIDARSVEYKNAFKITNTDKQFIVDIENSLSLKIDSGNLILFRPSNSKLDILLTVEQQTQQITFKKEDLINGRYILKFYWYSEGLKYEVRQPVNVQ